MEHILKLEQVKKYYGGAAGNITKAVDGISMEVNKGEFTAIMGASGSGKTTLLNCNFHDRHRNRRYTLLSIIRIFTKIKEKDFASFRRKNLGFIFQDFNLLDTLTIEENISLSLIINKRTVFDRAACPCDCRQIRYPRYFIGISLRSFRRSEAALCLRKSIDQRTESNLSR